MSKKLVAWFSVSGVTAKVAREIAAVEGADCFEIVPEAPYTAADLDWTNKQSRSTLEMADPNCRPATTGCVEDMAQYDVIFVGFPIWYYGASNIIITFLKSYDLTGKKIALFATSGGSDIGKTADKIKPLVPGALNIVAAKLFQPDDSEDTLRRWAESVL